MPNSTELQKPSSSEDHSAEHPLESKDIPNYSEHMTERESQELDSAGQSIEERQKFIEDPEERKAKIRSVLRELKPEDIFNDDFNPEDYKGDNANDFFDDLDDSFILQHIDDLMSCGVKAETIDEFTNDLFTQNQSEDLLIENIDPVLSHIGHGISFDTFMDICHIDQDEIDGDPLIPAAKYILDEAYEYNGGEIDPGTIKTMLKNGFTAEQIVSSNPYIDRGFDESVDALLDAGANPNKIVELYTSQNEYGPLLYKIDSLVTHGADIDIDKIIANAAFDEDGTDAIKNNLEMLLKHGADKDKLSQFLPFELVDYSDYDNVDESFIEFVENRKNDAEVKEKLSEFISKGVNIGYIINFFCYKDGSIDENGTGNIELNLDDPSVVKGFEELLQYVDMNQILPHLSADTIALNTKFLEEKGADLKPYEKNIEGVLEQAERERLRAMDNNKEQ